MALYMHGLQHELISAPAFIGAIELLHNHANPRYTPPPPTSAYRWRPNIPYRGCESVAGGGGVVLEIWTRGRLGRVTERWLLTLARPERIEVSCGLGFETDETVWRVIDARLSFNPLDFIRWDGGRLRSVTFLKRKGGLFKKAHELSVLCSVDVAVIIFGHNKKLYEYSSSDINEIIGRFQYYGGAHEHKGPADFADKGGGGDDDDDDEGGDEGDEGRNTPAPDQPSMGHPPMQMQQHPGFQHVRHGTPSGSPPMHNGAMPQFVRVPSPLPPGTSRPSSRTAQHPPNVRRPSSNLAPPHMQTQGPPPQPSYAYTPNPPFYNPQAAAQMQPRPEMQVRPVQQSHQATYPPPYPPVTHAQIQQAYMADQRRSSGPPAFPPQPAPQANMQRPPSDQHLQPPQHRPMPSPQPHQGPPRPSPSPQPPQQHFASPAMPQPRPLPAAAKSQSIFTPIDDSRSMLAQHWGASIDSQIDPAIKLEGGSGPRSQSIDIAAMHRERQNAGHHNGLSPKPPPSANKTPLKSPQPPQRTTSTPIIGPPQRTATMSSDAKRPRLKVQIPSEQQSGDEGGGSPSADNETAATTAAPHTQQQAQQRVLPPPSPSTNALLSAGAQGPPNPFARPAPPMSTNPHALNRDAAAGAVNQSTSTGPGGGVVGRDYIETPISALPSRFMNQDLLPSPSNFFPEWGFGRGGGSAGGMDGGVGLPSPLNFQTPVVGNGPGWRQEEERERERKRGLEEGEGGGGGDGKRVKT
ncbi:hypothetical protein BAUCODRAFT_25460 [Baudoinia panamericana UAMH 10762]|uniref:MADS-box domain-containing protein n=1 Tax=Baudoinia panamericana (strain UAMH 10762) TaxID=717646 RepID=M2MFK4_BAUPA|nr:uncharacterized protein BAUCODRAFT_25460 [Baudoinia panamericana UAMH 10762]EMC95431.1 hypothetical protein BAUCODRAFT_25460 [Baudoinia panamericana UAMH 10762]